MSLKDTKTAVDELHNLLNVLVAIIILIIWLIILGVSITHFLVFVSSQLLLAVFIFGNTCRTVFEAIVFLFVMHPFDVGDRCEVEGVQVSREFLDFIILFIKYLYISSKLLNHLSFFFNSDVSGRDEYHDNSFSET